MKIRTALKTFFGIRNYDRIPRLPRGYLSGAYERMEEDERRVLARIGARDPRGAHIAMRRLGVESLHELAKQLHHQRAQRNLARRFVRALTRLMKSTSAHPHAKSIKRYGKPDASQRLRKMVEHYEREGIRKQNE